MHAQVAQPQQSSQSRSSQLYPQSPSQFSSQWAMPQSQSQSMPLPTQQQFYSQQSADQSSTKPQFNHTLSPTPELLSQCTPHRVPPLTQQKQQEQERYNRSGSQQRAQSASACQSQPTSSGKGGKGRAGKGVGKGGKGGPPSIPTGICPPQPVLAHPQRQQPLAMMHHQHQPPLQHPPRNEVPLEQQQAQQSHAAEGIQVLEELPQSAFTFFPNLQPEQFKEFSSQ